MTKRALYLAAVLSVCCYSYSYSDIITGTTNNAVTGGLQWDMDNVLPPQAGLTVDGIIYRYTVEKERLDDFSVTVQNEDRFNGGNIIEYTDDWSGISGSTLLKQYPLGDILGERIGDGSITTEGEGTVTDADVRYNYKYDECYIVLSNPECPGYAEAYLLYLYENGLIDLDGPDYDPENDINIGLDNETDVQEEESDEDKKEEEEDEKEDDMEKLLSIAKEKNELAEGAAQQAMLQALTQVEKLNSYIAVDIQGGEYTESVVLRDKKISDNRSAARRMGLAQDKVHEEIVASQYNKGN
jgi:hypothetical protein